MSKKVKTPPKNSGGPHDMMMGDKPKNMKKSLKTLFGLLSQHRLALTFVLIFCVCATAFNIAGPKILGNATTIVAEDYIRMVTYDRVINNLPEGMTLPKGTTGKTLLDTLDKKDLEQIPDSQLKIIEDMSFDTKPKFRTESLRNIAIFLISIYIISALFSYFSGLIMVKLSQKITYKLRKDISEKMNKLPLSYFDKIQHGDVLSRITNDVDTLSQNLSQNLSQAVMCFTSVIGILVMMFIISPIMTLIAILILPISFVLVGIIMGKSQKYFTDNQKYLADINGHVEEMYSGHNVVKVFNGEEASIKKFDEINDKLYNASWKSQFISGLMFPIIIFVGNIGYVAVSVLGGSLVVDGKIKIGDIQSFIQYVRNFTESTSEFGAIAASFQSIIAASERIMEFLEEKEEIKEIDTKKINNVSGEIEFNNIHFGYKENVEVIKGFSTFIKPGMKVAIVGPTGAGKTTIVKLLMRFYDIDKGLIKLDGINIKDYDKHDLRDQFGMVLQDTWLFNGSIKDNIKYGNPKASDEEILEACKSARVDHFIHTLPDGYDMVLNEEANNISQGQKQLLTIARAILKDPKILILDEATSSVDTRTEVLIQEAMENLMKNRTSFIIAHRLSTIRNADIILVMKDGDIIETGNHEELINKNGFYASLYNSQFEPEEGN